MDTKTKIKIVFGALVAFVFICAFLYLAFTIQNVFNLK